MSNYFLNCLFLSGFQTKVSMHIYNTLTRATRPSTSFSILSNKQTPWFFSPQANYTDRETAACRQS
jgi:hypothetical protein